MLIVILTVTMILCYALQGLFAKLFAGCYGKDSSTAALIFAVIFGMFIAVGTLVTGGGQLSFSTLTICFALIESVMLVGYHLTQIGASVRGSYAIMSLCMLFGGIIFPMIVSTITLNQRLTGVQIVAVIIMLISFVLLNIQGASLKGTKKGYWLYCILLALSNGGYGVVISLQSGLLSGAERTEMICLSYAASAVLAFLVLVLRRGKVVLSYFRMNGRAAGCAFGCGVVATIAVNLYLYLLSGSNTTVLNTLNNGGVLVCSSLFAVVLFGEKLTKLQLSGLLMALCSIIMLSLS